MAPKKATQAIPSISTITKDILIFPKAYISFQENS